MGPVRNGKFFWRKFQKMHFPLKMNRIDSTPQELSNEWSCQYVTTILYFLGEISVSRPWSPSVLKELIFDGLVFTFMDCFMRFRQKF
jgi:hypothetical protein